MPLILRLLGPFDVRPVEGALSRKARWLLALLALRPGREVDRAWLAGTLWPETSESQAFYDLRRELSRLRRALGGEAARLCSPAPHALLLDLAGADVDVIAFDEALARGDLERAVTEYRGPLLEGCTEGWAVEEREARAQAYLAALEALAEREVARGDLGAAVRHLRLVTAADPLREGAQRALMRALSASGAHAAATQAYRDLRLVLERELAAEPAPETRALYREVRVVAQARAAVAAPPAPSPGRVPRPLTPLVGRAGEVREIGARVGATRLLTLTGSGGVGKSRLAIQVAADRAGDFADGAFFVELAPLSDPELVVPAVAQVLGVIEAPGRPLGDLVAGFLRGRQVLLVLDNCEHVVDAAGRLAERLLHECPSLWILATSRQSLGLSGEVAWRVPSLTAPEAIELFHDRAHERAGQIGDPEAVAQICRRLDGIPLAIELAAARTRALTIPQIAARLDDRFRLLTGGSRTALPRHRTLKATVDWGYQLLTAEEQGLLRRLSVFAGGFSLEAAEAVAGGDVLDPLESLVDKSLVAFDGRYRLLETVRSYAAERLDERGETDDARARHLDHYVRLVEAAEPHIFGGQNDRRWVDQLEEENDNVRGALDYCHADPPPAGDARRAEAALRVVAALHWFWFARGHLREARARVAAAVARRALVSAPVRARALAAAGYVAMWVGDHAGMSLVLEESLALARELGDHRLSAYALTGIGAAATLQGDPASARPLFEQAVALARAEGDPRLLVFALYWLGSAEQAARDLAPARRSFTEGLALARSLDNRPGIGHTLYRLGDVASAEGHHDEARRLHLESLRMLAGSADHLGIALALDALGRLAAVEGRAARGARLLGAAEALCERIGGSLMLGDLQGRDRAVAAARGALGEQAFASAWAEGRDLQLEQAVAEAGQEPPHPP